MDIYTNEGKQEIIKKYTPKTRVIRNTVFAFIFGGFIVLCAELLRRLYIYVGMEEKDSLTLVSVSFILLASVLTALGFFDRIARYAGAGTLVPITGFSNAVTSPAIDSKNEGFVLGVGANMFKIAGPVIAYGTVASMVYGVIYWATTIF